MKLCFSCFLDENDKDDLVGILRIQHFLKHVSASLSQTSPFEITSHAWECEAVSNQELVRGRALTFNELERYICKATKEKLREKLHVLTGWKLKLSLDITMISSSVQMTKC